jgi:arginase family enzyme
MALVELERLLRPAAGGLHTVSTGRAAQLELQKALYGVGNAQEIPAAWRRALAAASTARVVILGIPSDCGAGLVRGASFGPQALRLAVMEARPDFAAWAAEAGVVDIGDVAVIPHLLHDDMVSEPQKAACRAALYPEVPPAEAALLPVAPLSIAERALDHLLALNPTVKLFVLGGDHSVAWPVVSALARRRARPFAIVQPDAHTDLLPDRLGVRLCFATWAYHANELVGRGGRLVQVGIRASSRTKEHWEQTLGVRQFWPRELEALGEARALDAIVDHLKERGVEEVYFSNDIDGTDALFAPSTGAAEPGGLTPDFVRALVGRLGEAFQLVGADLVEIAPPVGGSEDSRRTLDVGASYVLASLEALLRSSRP